MAREARGSHLLVGDLSSEFGCPFAGHHSHQSGRDADEGFFVVDANDRPRQLDRFVAFDAGGAEPNETASTEARPQASEQTEAAPSAGGTPGNGGPVVRVGMPGASPFTTS